MQLRELARGRWRGILAELGVEESFLRNVHGPCPICGGTDRYRFDDKRGEGTFYCNHCGAGDGFSLLEGLHGWDFARAAREVERVVGRVPAAPTPEPKPDVGKVNRLLRGARAVTPKDPAGRYLASRGCPLPEADVFFQPRAYGLGFGGPLPCMVALIKGPDGSLLGAHKTFLRGAAKAQIDSPRQITKLSSIRGGAVRLFPATAHLAVAEGIETSLAVHSLSHMPTWAAISANGMRSFAPPPGVSHLHIYADHDAEAPYPGQRAAYELAARALAAGIYATVYVPPAPGTDWLDHLNAQKARAAWTSTNTSDSAAGR